MAVLDGLIWVEQMNYPCFDFPIHVSHETWLLSPLPNSIPVLLLTVLKKHARAQRQRGKEVQLLQGERHLCAFPHVRVLNEYH